MLIAELLGIRHPILCGGLGPKVADADYVAAVVNAGGMGFIVAAGFPDPDEFREQLRRCRQLTDRDGTRRIAEPVRGRCRAHLALLLVARRSR